MSPEEKTRLDVIATRTTRTWIDQQILETTAPPSAEACEDRVECVVNKAVDWRRDYIAALNLARTFNSVAEYDDALDALSRNHDVVQAQAYDAVRGAINAVNAAEFDDAVRAILAPATLIGQKVFLEKIRRVSMYLQGGLTEPDDFKHIRPGLGGSTQNLFKIMQDDGTFDEWRGLIDKLSGPQAKIYAAHIKNPSP